MCQVLESIIIGLGTGIASGILTGIATGVIVTRHYRKKDDKRDTEKFVRDLKRHIVSVYRILREIKLSSDVETKIEQIEYLKRELLYAPIFEERFGLSKQEEKILEEYNKNLKNLKDELSEYSRCRSVIYMLEKYQDESEERQHLNATRKQYEIAIDRLGAYNSIWLVLMHDAED